MEYINNNISIDTILNGKITLKQFQSGYRVGIDAILLASMVTNNSNKIINVLDLGSGVGSVSFCILYRLLQVKVTSIEKVSSYYKLCLENFALNSFIGDRYTPLLGEIDAFQNLFNCFDIVVSNPPYYKNKDIKNSKNPLKDIANVESTANLLDFINIAYKYLKPKGKVFIIQKTSRVLDILNNININCWGDITIYPIYSFENKIADRSIISMKKFSKDAFKITRGIVIHNKDYSYTEYALDIILNGKSYFETELHN